MAKPAKDCKTLAELRTEIDRIDRELVRLIAERSGFVRRAAELKTRREEILDPERIAAILAEIKREAEKLGLDPEVAQETFRAMIDRFVAYEYKEFDRRKGG
jgi:isochorismate pyruvate lyase